MNHFILSTTYCYNFVCYLFGKGPSYISLAAEQFNFLIISICCVYPFLEMWGLLELDRNILSRMELRFMEREEEGGKEEVREGEIEREEGRQRGKRQGDRETVF